MEVEHARKALREGTGGEAARLAKRAADERFAAIATDDRLIHADVDGDAVARVVATWTGIPVGKMQSDTISSLLTLEDRLGGRVRGQSSAVQVAAELEGGFSGDGFDVRGAAHAVGAKDFFW